MFIVHLFWFYNPWEASNKAPKAWWEWKWVRKTGDDTRQIMHCWTTILLFHTSVVAAVLLHKQSPCKASPLLSSLNVKSQNESACCFPPRHSSDKVSKLEGTVEHYKKKLEDMGLLRRQVHRQQMTAKLSIFIMMSSTMIFIQCITASLWVVRNNAWFQSMLITNHPVLI